MPSSLASVVIPAFNAERFLREAIESALGQTYEPVEVVVVDDGSTDHSAEIAASYDGVVLVRQPNRGLSAARNAGVAASQGEYVAFNDADDVLLPEKLEIQVGHLLEHPRVGCVLGEQELIVEEGAEMPFWVAGTKRPILGSARPEQYRDEPNVHTVTMVMPRRVFDEVGGFDTRFRSGEDIDILFRLREAGVEIARLPRVVVRHRVHDGSMTQRFDASKQGIFRAFKARMDRQREPS